MPVVSATARMRSRSTQAGSIAAALLLSALLCLRVAARPAPARTDDHQITAAKALLASSDHDEIEAGIQSLGLIGTPAAVAPLIDRVRAGLPADLLETAIVTLMALGQPEAAPLFFELLEYRRPDVRIRAIEGIVALKPKGAEEAMQKLLSDMDPRVRSAAALALGELKAAGSVELLFRALDHGNFEASQAIGQAVRSDQVPRLLGYLGSIPFRSLSPAFTEILQRKDIGERDKLNVVSRLQDVGTHEVKNYFSDVMRATGGKLPAAVNRAVVQAMQEIAD
jgi:HEAT repeat protein